MKRLFLTIVILTIILFPKEISAQGLDLSVAPPVFEIELKPPAQAKINETITLTNHSSEALELTLKIRQFEPTSQQDGTLTYLPENAPIKGENPEILSRITILDGDKPASTFTIPPQSEKKLSLSVAVPEDEPPSDYYFSLIFLSEKEDGKETQTIASGGIGINVLLTIGPKTRASAVIEEFSAPKIVQSGPVPFTTRLTNTSRHFIYPKGQILIYNMFGQLVGNVSLIPVNILSQSTRAIPSREQVIYEANKKEPNENEEQSFLEKVSSEHPVSIWNEGFLFGPYKAHLRLALTDEGPLVERDIWFFAFPLQALIGIVIAIGLTIYIKVRLKEHAKKI